MTTSEFTKNDPGGGVLYIYILWVRARAIGMGTDFHDFGIRNGINFQDFGIRNSITIRDLHFRICIFGKLV